MDCKITQVLTFSCVQCRNVFFALFLRSGVDQYEQKPLTPGLTVKPFQVGQKLRCTVINSALELGSTKFGEITFAPSGMKNPLET